MNNLRPWQPMLHQMLTELQSRCQERDKNCYVTMQDGRMGGIAFASILWHGMHESLRLRLVVAAALWRNKIGVIEEYEELHTMLERADHISKVFAEVDEGSEGLH